MQCVFWCPHPFSVPLPCGFQFLCPSEKRRQMSITTQAQWSQFFSGETAHLNLPPELVLLTLSRLCFSSSRRNCSRCALCDHCWSLLAVCADTPGPFDCLDGLATYLQSQTLWVWYIPDRGHIDRRISQQCCGNWPSPLKLIRLPSPVRAIDLHSSLHNSKPFWMEYSSGWCKLMSRLIRFWY